MQTPGAPSPLAPGGSVLGGRLPTSNSPTMAVVGKHSTCLLVVMSHQPLNMVVVGKHVASSNVNQETIFKNGGLGIL